MRFRKIRAKRYSGIYEYFKDSDNDKRTIAYYHTGARPSAVMEIKVKILILIKELFILRL
ncbi:MAG: hypothetical protein U9R39_05830 [Campylobacterota bacterium]|nr:hypothetical protein [Campylobacterota bacterium]